MAIRDDELPQSESELVGWLKHANVGFDNDRDYRCLLDFTGVELNPERLRYFESYADRYYHDRFISGQGTEAILDQLRRFGRPGDWLDLGAGTTTLFWSIPLTGIRGIDCADIVVEALAVLARRVRMTEHPPCYAQVLELFDQPVDALRAAQRALRRFLVFDILRAWPVALAPERFDLVTAIGVLSTASNPTVYAAALAEIANHLIAGGRVIGADWIRRPSFIARDGHDNSFLGVAQIHAAAQHAGLQVLECRREPVAGDRQFDGVLCWALERPAG